MSGQNVGLKDSLFWAHTKSSTRKITKENKD